MRLVLGPIIAAFTIARTASPTPVPHPVTDPLPPGTPVKSDPVIAFKSMDEVADPLVITVTVPPYDLATSNKLVGVSVVVIPADHGQPTTAEAWLASPYPQATVDTSTIQAGADVPLSIAGVPDGKFLGQTILAYDA